MSCFPLHLFKGINMKRTISEIIKEADALCPNKFDNKIKIAWLSRLDMIVTDEIIRKHENGRTFMFEGYNETTSGEKELLIPEPYTDVYIHWLHSKMYLFEHDYERYNSATSAFYASYQNYAAHYNRENKPVSPGIKMF